MLWADIFQSLVTLLGVYTALYGIDSWRREHSGKKKIDLAEESLALFYEAQDAIAHIRHPLSFGSETEHFVRADDESEKDFEARKRASVVFKRYNEYQELFNRLHSMRYRYMAQIGTKEAEPFDELRCIVNEIILSARKLARLWAHDHFRTPEAKEAHFQRIEKAEAIFWEGSEEDDPLKPKLQAVMIKMEDTSRRVIEGKGTIYGILNYKFWQRS